MLKQDSATVMLFRCSNPFVSFLLFFVVFFWSVWAGAATEGEELLLLLFVVANEDFRKRQELERVDCAPEVGLLQGGMRSTGKNGQTSY